jgi:hypothetical protein
MATPGKSTATRELHHSPCSYQDNAMKRGPYIRPPPGTSKRRGRVSPTCFLARKSGFAMAKAIEHKQEFVKAGGLGRLPRESGSAAIFDTRPNLNPPAAKVGRRPLVSLEADRVRSRLRSKMPAGFECCARGRQRPDLPNFARRVPRQSVEPNQEYRTRRGKMS